MASIGFIGGGLAACLVATSALADDAPSNKDIVVNFYTMSFVQHRPVEAAKTYIGPVYIQHNPHVPNGAAAFTGYFDGFFKKNPDATSSIKHVLAEGDLVAIHSWSRLTAQDRGKAIVDIFRVADNKIVEHWDVIQEVPEATANGNTMFDGDNAK